MNPEANKVLKKIVKKDLMELTYEDKAFLQARRAYLNTEQAEKFDSVLKETLVEPEEPTEPAYLSYKEVQDKAKDLGIPYHRVKREELLVAISTIEGPEGSPKPE